MMLWTWISWFSVNLLWNSVYCEKHYTNKIYLTWFIIVRQSCRLGQHRPIAKTHADGIVTVSDTGSKALMDQTLTDWLPKTINSSSEAFNKLKLYAQVCCHDLGMCTNKLWCCVDKVMQQSYTISYLFSVHSGIPVFGQLAAFPAKPNQLYTNFQLWQPRYSHSEHHPNHQQHLQH